MSVQIDEYQYRKILGELALIRNDMRLLSQQIADVNALQMRYLELLLARGQVGVWQSNSAIDVRDNARVTARDIVGGDESKRDDVQGTDMQITK